MPDATIDPSMPAATTQSWPLAEGVYTQVAPAVFVRLTCDWPGWLARLFGAKPTFRITVSTNQ